MATFTIRIQQLIEENFDFGLTEDDYPIFDERWRGFKDERNQWQYTREDGEFYGLNKKILDHFMYHEIGQETPDVFRHVLNRKMREIMPYYNQLYRTELLIDDPLVTSRMTHTTESESEVNDKRSERANATATAKSGSKSRAVNSTFPQNQLNNTGDYASSATDSFADSDSENESETVGDVESEAATTGRSTLNVTASSGARGALLRDYRNALINVDIMILAELESLFMQVMEITDSYTQGGGRGVPYTNSYGFWPYY